MQNYYEILKLEKDIFSNLEDYDLKFVDDIKSVNLTNVQNPTVFIVGKTAYIVKDHKFVVEEVTENDKLIEKELTVTDIEITPEEKNKLSFHNINVQTSVLEKIAIKKASQQYKKLARSNHVDKGAENDDIIKKLNEAKEVLTDKDKRKEYKDNDFEPLQTKWTAEEESKGSNNSASVVKPNASKRCFTEAELTEIFKYANECNDNLEKELASEIQKIQNKKGKKVSEEIEKITEKYNEIKTNNSSIARYCAISTTYYSLVGVLNRKYNVGLKTSKTNDSVTIIKNHMKQSLLSLNNFVNANLSPVNTNTIVQTSSTVTTSTTKPCTDIVLFEQEEKEKDVPDQETEKPDMMPLTPQKQVGENKPTSTKKVVYRKEIGEDSEETSEESQSDELNSEEKLIKKAKNFENDLQQASQEMKETLSLWENIKKGFKAFAKAFVKIMGSVDFPLMRV